MSAKLNEEFGSNGAVGESGVDKKSFRLVAALIFSETGGMANGRKVLTFRAEGRGVDKADAMINATAMHLFAGKVVEAELAYTVTDYGNGLFLHIAHIVSGARCQTCGHSRNDPSAWCDDDEGCESFRKEGVKAVAPTASVVDMQARMKALLGK